MRPVFNSAQMRRADEIMQIEYGYLSILLMESAGRQTARRILSHYPQQHTFVVIAGSGNNGGDGLVVARYLYRQKKKNYSSSSPVHRKKSPHYLAFSMT